MLRRRFLQSVAITALSLSLPDVSEAAFAIFQTSVPTATQSWQTLLIGGGGYMTGLDIAPDGTKLARSDTPPSPYVWSAAQNKWLPLSLSTSMPAGFVSPRSDKSVGTWEARVCPSLTSKFYMIQAGAFFVSTDSGGTWVQRTFPGDLTDADANNSYRGFGFRMAVHPTDDKIVYVGTPSHGVYVTTDSGQNWSQISTSTIAAAAVACGNLIVFAPNGDIFIASYGTGVYRSTNGGGSWTLLNTSGMPTRHCRMKVDQNGKLWVCSVDASAVPNGLYSWTSGGGWVHVGNATTDAQSWTFAVDPGNANNIILIGGGGRMLLSNDGGSTWPMDTGPGGTPATFTLNGSGDATWLGTPFSQTGGSWGLTSGNVEFDPNQSHVLYYSWGFGLMTCTFPTVTAGGTIAWQSQARGISGLDGLDILHPPSGSIIGAAYDLETWPALSTSSYATKYGPDSAYNGPQPNGGAHRCWNLDYAKSSPSTVASAGGGGLAAKSSDGGSTWTAFSSQTPFSNGDSSAVIAASTPTNLVAASGGTSLYYSTNGGTSWTAASYGGTTSILGKGLCADSVTAGTFYIYSPAAAGGASGFYKSTDNGATFSRVSTTTFANEGFAAVVKSVPGNAGHLFGTGGWIDSGTPPAASDPPLVSTDAGTTWNSIANWTEVMQIGFGTIVSGQSYPTIYMAGWYNGVFGVYKCSDFNPSTRAGTWTLLAGIGANNSYPEGWYAPITGLAGNPSVDGACSVAFANGGFKRFA